MEISMYVCTNCNRVYKIKGNDKRAKCPHCEGMFLKDMHESLEQWQEYSKDEKNARISQAKMSDSDAGSAAEQNDTNTVAQQNEAESATEQDDANTVAQQKEAEPATVQDDANTVAQQNEAEPVAQPTETKPAGGDLFGFGFEEDENALAEFGFDLNKGNVKSFDFGDEEEDNLFSSFSAEDEAPKPTPLKRVEEASDPKLPQEESKSDLFYFGDDDEDIGGDSHTETKSDISPAHKEEIRHVISEDTAPAMTAESEPVISEDMAPAMTAETKPIISEDMTPAMTAESEPVISEDTAPAKAAESEPVISEDAAPAKAAESKPVISEDITPEKTAETKPIISEDTAPAKAADTPSEIKADITENAAERKPEIHRAEKIINEYHYEEQVGNLKLKRIFSATGMAVGLIIAGVGAYMSATGMDFGMDKATTALPIPGIIADCLGMVVVCHFGVKLSETLDNNK